MEAGDVCQAEHRGLGKGDVGSAVLSPHLLVTIPHSSRCAAL